MQYLGFMRRDDVGVKLLKSLGLAAVQNILCQEGKKMSVGCKINGMLSVSEKNLSQPKGKMKLCQSREIFSKSGRISVRSIFFGLRDLYLFFLLV